VALAIGAVAITVVDATTEGVALTAARVTVAMRGVPWMVVAAIPPDWLPRCGTPHAPSNAAKQGNIPNTTWRRDSRSIPSLRPLPDRICVGSIA